MALEPILGPRQIGYLGIGSPRAKRLELLAAEREAPANQPWLIGPEEAPGGGPDLHPHNRLAPHRPLERAFDAALGCRIASVKPRRQRRLSDAATGQTRQVLRHPDRLAARLVAQHGGSQDAEQDHCGERRQRKLNERASWAQPSEVAACFFARSMAATTSSGSLTPLNLKSELPVPAVSKSTVPTFSSRSIPDWSVLTFWTRTMSVCWMCRAMIPCLMRSRLVVIV